MPKAAVHEHHKLFLREDEIRRPNYGKMPAPAFDAMPAEEFDQANFSGLIAFPADMGHDL